MNDGGASDLAALFAPAPAGTAQPVLYRQGIVRAFNPVTLENTVQVGGTPLTNLPLLGVAEAASLGPGSVVGIHCVGNSWAIVGRFVTPNTADATDAITQLDQRFYTASVAASQTTTSVSFVDLTTVGPSVDALIGASGRALVIMTSAVHNDNSTNGIKSAQVTYTISGATTRAADPDQGLQLSATMTGDPAGETQGRMTAISLAEGLTPGINTFKMVYRSGTGATTLFAARNLTVIAL